LLSLGIGQGEGMSNLVVMQNKVQVLNCACFKY